MRSLPLVAIRRRALVALLLLTALIGGSFVAQHIAAARQERTSHLIAFTQRQAMLTERVALLAQALGSDLTPGQRTSAQGRLSNAINLMASSQHALLAGDPHRGMPAEKDPTVLHAYRAGGLDKQVRDFLSHA